MCFLFDIAAVFAIWEVQYSAGGWEAGNEISGYEEEMKSISDVYI